MVLENVGFLVRPFEFEDAEEDGVIFVGLEKNQYIVQAEENNNNTLRIKVVKITGGEYIHQESRNLKYDCV